MLRRITKCGHTPRPADRLYRFVRNSPSCRHYAVYGGMRDTGVNAATANKIASRARFRGAVLTRAAHDCGLLAEFSPFRNTDVTEADYLLTELEFSRFLAVLPPFEMEALVDAVYRASSFLKTSGKARSKAAP